MKWFLLLFIVMPACELGVLIWSGRTFGILPTVLLIITTGIGGVYLAKYQGLKTMRKVQEQLNMGIMPNEQLIDGICILLGGVLLLAPGFLTDILGLVLLLPLTRVLIKKPMKKMFYKKIKNNTITIIQ